MFHNDHAIAVQPLDDDCSVAPSQDRSQGPSILFGPFRLYPGARELKRNGIRLAVGSRALDILIALTGRAGEVVSHKELTRLVWRGLVVSPGSLRVHIAGLRKALGRGKEECRYIANVPGQGYCFVAPIRRLDGAASGSGKAGLAIQAVAEILRNFANGCRLIELPPLGDATHVAQTVANVLDSDEASNGPLTQPAAGHPATRRLLLVLED